MGLDSLSLGFLDAGSGTPDAAGSGASDAAGSGSSGSLRTDVGWLVWDWVWDWVWV